jgi:hypothetical protein
LVGEAAGTGTVVVAAATDVTAAVVGRLRFLGDFFPPTEWEAARAAVDDLAEVEAERERA